MNRATRTMCIIFVFVCLGWVVCWHNVQAVGSTAEQLEAEEKIGDVQQLEEKREAATKAKRQTARIAKRKAKEIAKQEQLIQQLTLPEDNTHRFAVKELHISGNTLISTEELLIDMPLVYNASDKPLLEAEKDQLYDLRILHDIINQPGQTQEVSAKTILGFTQYILSAYLQRNYAGIYVYVPRGTLEEGAELKDQVLTFTVLEALLAEVRVKTYDPNHVEKEQGRLNPLLVKEWSPAKPGQVLNKKKVDDFVNLLNMNPDRYVSAIITKGSEPNSLALTYDIYEAEPWHYYIQVDNSGTNEREWAPRLGLINTNLTGRDDRFNAMFQAPWESGIEDNYAMFGSYDVPFFTQSLRLNLYGGYSEFDVTPDGGPFNFLGRGSFYGGILRYNVLQRGNWFFDVFGSLSQERSKVTPSLFPAAASNVRMDLYGTGAELRHSDDMMSSSLGINRQESFNASDKDEFNLARTGSDPDFTVYTTSFYHSRYLDPDKIERFSGSFRWITSNERLVPAKMTSFGGLYSVRGYDEYEFVADGGILASVQYEFDLVKNEEAKEIEKPEADQQRNKKYRLRKLAPLVFVDYGRAKIKDHVAGEKSVEELASVGVGGIVELGDNFSGAVYYGYPLTATDDTNQGKGRLNVSVILRF